MRNPCLGRWTRGAWRWKFAGWCVLLLVLHGTAAAASPGELLEKAVYAEETVGDLDAAITLYQQVVAESRAVRRVGAEAQYRLGICYRKQQKPEQARAAFEALLKEYGEETEWVAKARQELNPVPVLLAPPWPDDEQLYLEMKLASGLPVGTMIYRMHAAAATATETAAWHCTTRGFVQLNGTSSYSHVVCDRESFAPRTSHWRHSLLGEATATYGPQQVLVTLTGKEEPVAIPREESIWDNEQCVQLFRRLPLSAGYRTSLPVLTSISGQKIALDVEVTEKITLTVPAGTFECYKLVLGLVGQTFWISADAHRYPVRFEAGGVVAELARVEHGAPESPSRLSVDGMELTLPAGWSHDAPPQQTGTEAAAKAQTIRLFDPEAQAVAQVSVRPITELTPEERASGTVWVETFLRKAQADFVKFQLRDPGITKRDVQGRSVEVITADFEDQGRAMVLYRASVIGDASAVSLRIMAPQGLYAELLGEWDSLIRGIKVE